MVYLEVEVAQCNGGGRMRRHRFVHARRIVEHLADGEIEHGRRRRAAVLGREARPGEQFREAVERDHVDTRDAHLASERPRAITPHVLVGTTTVTGASASSPLASAIAAPSADKASGAATAVVVIDTSAIVRTPCHSPWIGSQSMDRVTVHGSGHSPWIGSQSMDRVTVHGSGSLVATAAYAAGMSIRRASAGDLGRLRVTAMRSFVDDPVMRWLYPDDETYLAPGGSSDHRGDDQLGPPRRGVVHRRRRRARRCGSIPDGPNSIPIRRSRAPSPELLQRFELLGPMMAENTPSEEHWYLQLLATHPDWQRQGLGAALMAVQFERADAEGRPCHLETETPENVAYYRRHGFEVRSEWDVDPDGSLGSPGPHMWGMLRPPH